MGEANGDTSAEGVTDHQSRLVDTDRVEEGVHPSGVALDRPLLARKFDRAAEAG
jgi:hypothetical protein